MPQEATVFVVDDNTDIRAVLVELVRSVGLRAKASASAEEFLRDFDPAIPGCLILDIHLPDMSGLDLYERLRADGIPAPVIFVTGQADVATVVRALKLGAMEFLEKPFGPEAVREALLRAVAEDRARRARDARWSEANQRLARLTRREREVLDLLIAGKPNKAIAAELQITERAVEMRRAALMRKLGATSLAQLLELVVTHRFGVEGLSAAEREPRSRRPP